MGTKVAQASESTHSDANSRKPFIKVCLYEYRALVHLPAWADHNIKYLLYIYYSIDMSLIKSVLDFMNLSMPSKCQVLFSLYCIAG